MGGGAPAGVSSFRCPGRGTHAGRGGRKGRPPGGGKKPRGRGLERRRGQRLGAGDEDGGGVIEGLWLAGLGKRDPREVDRGHFFIECKLGFLTRFGWNICWFLDTTLVLKKSIADVTHRNETEARKIEGAALKCQRNAAPAT